jgi:hypothetical protein
MKSKFIIIILFFSLFFTVFTNKSASAKIFKNYEKNNDSSYSYTVPSRMIILSPYVSYIYANNLFENTIKDQSGFGAGLNIRTQIYKDFGFMLDTLYTNLEIVKETIPGIASEQKSDLVAIFTGGFYYSIYYFSQANLRINLAYGAITAGDNVMTIFVPGIEYFEQVSDRILFFAKLSWLITNDWIVNQNYKEHYTSFSLSAGVSIIF